MARLIKCECGYVARGETDDEVVRNVQRHLETQHPQLAAAITRQDIYSWIEIE